VYGNVTEKVHSTRHAGQEESRETSRI
jgi:hypothetical protein